MNKATVSQRKTNNGVINHQQMVIESSMLPSAEELSRLKEVEPKLIDLIISATEKEQEARLKFNNDQVKLANKDLNGVVIPNILSPIFAFIIIVLGMFFAAYLIHEGSKTEGTIFGGAMIIGAAALFMKRNKKKTNNK